MISYPKHLFQPIRRKIAQDYLSHEFRKFFSTVNDEQTWQKMDEEIGTWFDGHHTFTPVRDFWNALHGVSRGFKLKNIVSWLTSENLEWVEEEIELEKLCFGVNFEAFKELRKQPSAVEVMDFLKKMSREEWDKLKKYLLEEMAHKNDVDKFPVIAVEREGRLVISDGNRRLLRAILMGTPKILAAIGRRRADPIIFNEWVPTSILLDLVGFARSGTQRNSISTDAVAEVIAGLIINSEAGKIEFFERSVDAKHPSDSVLIELVRKKVDGKSDVKAV